MIMCVRVCVTRVTTPCKKKNELQHVIKKAYKTNGKPLVYFAGFKNHIGFYATPTGHTQFEKELSKYKQGKGSVQFPLDKSIPLTLIAQIVKFRVEENNLKKRTK